MVERLDPENLEDYDEDIEVTQARVKHQKGEVARRSIENDAEDQWIGWPRVMELYDKSLSLDREYETIKHGLYFCALFETGGREAEVMRLQPKQFTWTDKLVTIHRMEVLKRRRRVTRKVLIKVDGDPLVPQLIEYVKTCETKYLLPELQRFTGEVVPGTKYHVSATTIYNTVTRIDPNVWPHWLRDQRSWQLSAKPEEGGRGFDAYLLKEWFKWASMDMPAHYAGRRSEKDLLTALGLQ